ncbi:Imm50 family immunity protein [Streptomyces bikiniensis]|uniref:Imm50 family immunity protein n=1 Tax=Streptomyces bikiniensis TaxID=1896 RepID=A0ABW8CP72_STRBI
MSEFDWTAIVGSTEEVADTYTTPPDLKECKLHYAQIDERGTSVTLMLETTELPDKPALAWANREYNTVEIYLRFTGVKGLKINGWEAGARDAEIILSPQGSKGVRVSVEAAGSQLSFEASESSLIRTRSYLSGKE